MNHNKNRTINIKKILFDTFLQNKYILFSAIALFFAYFLQDIVFPRKFSKFTTNVPDFIHNLSFSNVFSLIYPYLLSELLFYTNNIIVSHTIPEIELSVVQKITDETLESMKTSKTSINTNEFIMNLKKIMESKSIYYLIVSNILPTILLSFALIYFFCKADLMYGLIVLLILTILFIVTVNNEANDIYFSRKNEIAINIFYDNIQDVMANAETVIVNNSKEKEIKNINLSKNDAYMNYANAEIVSSESTLKLHIIGTSIIIIVIGLAIYMHIHNIMTLETLISISIMSILFLQYFNNTIIRFKNALPQMGKLSAIIDYFSKFKIIEKFSIDNKLIITDGSITFKNIYLQYNNKTVIENFNLDIRGNSKVGIIGEVGTGKSTLLKILSNLANYKGYVYIDGQNLKNCDHISITDNIAYVPQNPKLFDNTILYNLSYGIDNTLNSIDNVNDIIYAFVIKMGFEQLFNNFPKKLETDVGKDGNNLSGGQRQIILLLRALIQDKKIILLDEPTSALDKDTKNIVINLLKNITNKTLVIVTHDSDLIDSQIFDNIVRI
jgi:ABC-type bacteriocin/lantibiotic exporter with double-glycine peptidase domain